MPQFDTAADTVAGQTGHFRRDIGLLAMLFACIGSIIGSGWLFGPLYSAQLAGPASILSWIIGGVMFLSIALVYAELGAMYPIAGGVVRYPHIAFGSLASFSMGWITWLGAVTLAPIEIEAALQYATNYLPWLTHESGGTVVLTGPGYGVAAGLMALFTAINLWGVRAFTRANTPVVWWKLFVIVAMLVAFLVVGFHGNRLTEFGGFAPYGANGIFAAVASGGVAFAFLGFRQAVELAAESKTPRRDVPVGVIGSIVITMTLYALIELVFVAAVPEGALANGWNTLSFNNDFGPLAGIATLLGLTWVAVILYIDAFFSPLDCGMNYAVMTARISYAAGRNRNAPSALTKMSARGVPWVSVLLGSVIGLLLFVPFPGWQTFVGFITSAAVLSFGSGPLVFGALRRQLPEAERPFKLPGGDVIPFLAFYSANLIVYWAGWDTNWKIFASIGVGFILLAIQQARNQRAAPPLAWRAGFWLAPWFVGLLVLSALGTFGNGAGLLSFGLSFPVFFVFSLLIYVIAVRLRLAPESVRHNIAEIAEEETGR